MERCLSNDRIMAFGLDFLRFSLEITPDLEIIVNRLLAIDDDNSNFCQFYWGEYHFSASRVGDNFMIMPVGFDFAFPIMRFSNLSNYDSGVYVDFYSSFFHWVACDDFLDWCSRNLDVQQFYRVDICLDIRDLSVADVFSLVDTDLKVGKINGFDKKNEQFKVETTYIGRFDNKRKLIRIYDKKLDSRVKHKTELYDEYFRFKGDVTRLEMELRNQACKAWNFTFFKLQDPEWIYHVFEEELDTQHVRLSIPKSRARVWNKKVSKARGVPDPVLRFREAMCRAYEKNIDIRREVDLFLS